MAVARGKKKTAVQVTPSSVPERGDRVAFTQDEIGGELVSLLSEGLYTNPLDALREYVQNSIDASATRVTLKVTGRSLFITDNGNGMSYEQLLKARRLAVSDKSLTTNIGFRGIGIYSAFHLCDRMRIKTKLSETFEQNVAEFDFAAMRAVLGLERGSGDSLRTPLTKLLTDHVRFWKEDNAFEDSRTVIELQNILPLYYSSLSSRVATEKYLLDTIPVNFAPDFKLGAEINADIRAAWSEYRPITIVLAYPGESDYTIAKKMPPNLVGPVTMDVLSPSGEKIAMIWGCRTNKSEMIGASDAAARELQGFVYKVKGVTVGGRAELREAFSQGALYTWWTGEVWVLNTNVVPNASRDAFEYNAPSRELKLAVYNTLRLFERETAIFQQTGRARANLLQATAEFDRLSQAAQKGILSPRDLGDLVISHEKVANASRALSKFAKGDLSISETIRECKSLASKINLLIKGAELGEPPSAKSERKKSVGASPPVVPEEQDDAANAAEATSTVALIGDILALLHLSDFTDTHAVLVALASSIEDVVSPSSQSYREIVEVLKYRLDELGLI